MRRGRDSGAGVVSTFIGASMFLIFVLFAAQLLLGLYAESVVAAVTYDAAKSAAGADVVSDPAAVGQVVADARRRLGRFGEEAVFEWAVSDDAVRLTVRVPRRSVLSWQRGPITRTVRVRAERVR